MMSSLFSLLSFAIDSSKSLGGLSFTCARLFFVATILYHFQTIFCLPTSSSQDLSALRLPTRFNAINCDHNRVTFELFTGFVYSSSSDIVAILPATLQLSDCISNCRNNQTCKSLNFETGLCILFNSSAYERPTALNQSQFPVFTIYAQKICLSVPIEDRCKTSWLFETVPEHALKGFENKRTVASSKIECMAKCYAETQFQCRSANFISSTGECTMSKMDRHSVVTLYSNQNRQFSSSPGVEYLECNCIDEPKKICEFKRLQGKVLKTVDSVFPEIKSYDECQNKCLQSDYRCFSFDLGDPQNKVCRTSHLDSSSLNHIKEAYFEIREAITYELDSCYEVNIVCKSREMIAKVRTNRVFNGKIYEKSKPNSCVNDIINDLDFDLIMGYNDINCNVRKYDSSKFSSDIVIQHHDLIVTTKDLGLSIQCSYDLSNRTVINTVFMESDGDIISVAKDERFVHSIIVESPNVTISINDFTGSPVRSARIGDQLVLRFAITDDNSPYEIFIRSLVATDGIGGSEMELISEDGCPIDIAIMGPVDKVKGSGKVIQTTFEAFKFPMSNMVHFRAIVSPCLAKCQPIHCYTEGFDGSTRSSFSYGRKKRSVDYDQDLILLQSIRIKDALNERQVDQAIEKPLEDHKAIGSDLVYTKTTPCMDMAYLSTICMGFFACQFSLICLWAYLRRSFREREEAKFMHGYRSATSRCSHLSSISSQNFQ